VKAKHVLVAGSAGGGKTTYCREMFAKHDGAAVWVNHYGERVPNATTCSSRGDLAAQAKRCTTQAELRRLRIDYRCDPMSGAADARRFARAIAQAADREVCTLVVIDEAHAVLPDNEGASGVNSGNSAAAMLHEDRDKNVKLALVTQDPTDLYYPPIKQCKHIVWCGEIKTFHAGFLRYFGIQDLDLPTEDHQYVVIKPTLPPKIVASGETDPDYG